MTEQNPFTDARQETAGPENPGAGVDWPEHTGETAVGDPTVDSLLARLGELPELPVAAHGEVYSGLHDDLAAALNEDVSGSAAGGTYR